MVAPSLVHDGFPSDSDVTKDETGVARVGISETDIRLHLVARDSDNHDLRVHTNGYLVTSSPSNVAIATEVSGIVPSGDVFALRFTGTGDVVLHVTTLNDDAPVTVDVPLHLTR